MPGTFLNAETTRTEKRNPTWSFQGKGKELICKDINAGKYGMWCEKYR
jgi:hypothetical protein